MIISFIDHCFNAKKSEIGEQCDVYEGDLNILQNLPFQICSILVAIAKCSVEHANMLRIHILQPISQVFRLLRLQQSIRNK